MDADYILLKAQHDAFRVYFMSLLKHIFRGDEAEIWFAKYCLWQFEHENLPSLTDELPKDIGEPVARRRFQLQTLIDIALIEGGLEDFVGLRKPHPIPACQRQYAAHVIEAAEGDLSEAALVEAIDRIEGYSNPSIYDAVQGEQT